MQVGTDYQPATKVIKDCTDISVKKAANTTKDIMIKGGLAGAYLAFAAAFAYKASTAFTGSQATLAAAILFPVGFVFIVLLTLELMTGNFAIMTMGFLARRVPLVRVLRNWGFVFVANFAGSVLFAFMMWITLQPYLHANPVDPFVDKIIKTATAKTLTYEEEGLLGWVIAFVKGILCNWMVTLGTVLGLSSTSSIGKIVACWLPITLFFALGYEHSVVNFFVIPAGMMLGAPVSIYQWWVWNQIPVTLGNILGGSVFTGILLYAIYGEGKAHGMPDNHGKPHGHCDDETHHEPETPAQPPHMAMVDLHTNH
jgi:formate/nitrite transporter